MRDDGTKNTNSVELNIRYCFKAAVCVEFWWKFWPPTLTRHGPSSLVAFDKSLVLLLELLYRVVESWSFEQTGNTMVSSDQSQPFQHRATPLASRAHAHDRHPRLTLHAIPLPHLLISLILHILILKFNYSKFLFFLKI